MSKQRTDKTNKKNNHDLNASDDQDSTVGLSTKLERRRRIEELNEERRLREELTAF